MVEGIVVSVVAEVFVFIDGEVLEGTVVSVVAEVFVVIDR